MSEEGIENITKSGGNFAQTFANNHLLPGINFNEHCLTKSNIYIPKNLENLHISYTLGPQLGNTNTDVTLSNCLFGSVKLVKNDDPDKQKYNAYGIRFDFRSEFSFTVGSIGRNVILLVADISSSVHVDNKGKYILILGGGPT